MKILALDVSTKSTGWFITKRSCGLLTLDPNLSFPDKLVEFRKEVIKLIRKYKPDIVVIEDTYARFGNVHTLKQLSRFAGVALEACASEGVQSDLITATQARKFCCGKQEGEFKKKEVFKYFVEEYNLKGWTFASHNDITDAMALARGYREIQRATKKKNQKKTRN